MAYDAKEGWGSLAENNGLAGVFRLVRFRRLRKVSVVILLIRWQISEIYDALFLGS